MSDPSNVPSRSAGPSEVLTALGEDRGQRVEPGYGIYPSRRFAFLMLLPAPLLLLAVVSASVAPLALLLNGMLLGFLALDYLRSGRASELVIRRRLKRRLSLGVDNRISIELRNLSTRPLELRITDDAPPSFSIEGADQSLSLAPLEERELSYQVRPHRRGDYQFRNIQVEILGPLGLARRVFELPAEEAVKVYPNLKGVEQWRLLTRRRHLAEIGVHKIRKRGSGSEFEQLRLYNRDDEFRHINWKATARRHKPITSVYQMERSQSVVVLLDAGRRMAAWVGGLSKLDYAINASLLLAYVASVGDDNIALGVFDNDLKTWLSGRKGRMQYRRFMEQLYAYEAERVYTDYRRSFLSIAQKMTKRSLVVIFTDILDPEAGAELERAVSVFRPRHLPLVVSLRDPEMTQIAERSPQEAEQMFESLVAQEVTLERRQLCRQVKRRGVHVIDALPEDFSVSVINEYLRLKARNEL